MSAQGVDIEHERLALQHLEVALEWPSEEREARLRAGLWRYPELLASVLELLASAESVGESLPTSLPIAMASVDPPPPKRIGPYRLGDLLGRGGMGSVYRAERADGLFEQTIAIKLTRRTSQPALVAMQFARERQILARLQHRNIAQLFDGGITEEGHSYFVMELVEGRTITQYVRDEKPGLRATVLLFRQVCAAVRYAHAHLVVHADIKPNNIIVMADGTAKLLDFGVAHVIDGSGQSEAVKSGPLGLTHNYASPARRGGEAPGTVDDVYSLGVLLEELLQDVPDVPTDLRSVCVKACAVEPAARYASVDSMQVDLEQWLDGEAVHAHGGAWSYVARKFLLRHRFGVAVSMSGVLLLVGAAAALAVLYVRAEGAKTQAEQRFNDVRSLSRYVLFDVYDRLEAVPRALTLRRDIADAGQRYLDRLAQDPDAPLAVRMEVIEGLRRLAQVQASPGSASLSQMPQARMNLDRAEAMARALPDDSDTHRTRSLTLAQLRIARARLAMATDLNFEPSQRALDEAERLLSPLRKEQAADAEVAGLQLDLAVERATIYQWQGEYAKSIEAARAALALAEAAAPDPVAHRANVRRRARLLDVLAESIFYAGDPPAAEQPYREQYDLLRQLSAAEPQDVAVSRQFQRAGWALGTTLLELKRIKEAEAILGPAMAGVEQLQLLEPNDKDLARFSTIVAGAEAQALAMLGRFEQAEPILERSIRTRKRLWDESPQNWSLARDYAIAVAALADARDDAGRTSRACADYAEAQATFDRIRAAGRLAKFDEDYALRLIHERVAAHCAG